MEHCFVGLYFLKFLLFYRFHFTLFIYFHSLLNRFFLLESAFVMHLFKRISTD